MAATEMESYIARLLEESGIKPHDVSARAKSIASFQRKQQSKRYADPVQEVTDIVAIRIITYSNTDRKRTGDLIRGRFVVKDGEDRNPGDEKTERLRGYDCLHIVVSGEDPGAETDWLVSGGKLARYFKEFGGLEIQIRTVAGHAWAEFEHARRYKGVQYQAINEQDQETIDQLFGAASDARRALDETFVAIDRILARPSVVNKQEHIGEELEEHGTSANVGSPLDDRSLAILLANRFPDDQEASEKGIAFGLELAQLCGLKTIESLDAALEVVDSEQVLALMDASGPVTRVRRLDDELLARYGEDYIRLTGKAGSRSTRAQQLDWRFDRLRGKARYKAYFIHGIDRPADLEPGPHTAARTVRELARLVAQKSGIDAVIATDAISRADDLPKGARAKEVPLSSEESIWVISNLNREYAEFLMNRILRQIPEFKLQVVRDDAVVAAGNLGQ
ncbi:GTP pyrophosphokinase [Arthrobacter alkaliphilus]|uniref:GTP pyrophosphokinase n=1 Tax=Arthrobacter alkaliphilus TaxID=369936 RepID=UPI001F43C479|nr:RelA/SpoT domain-containing protein [Arthrobacter alkaliphilus]